METFICASCKKEVPKHNYGTNNSGQKFCYACCAEKDKQALRDLKPGETTLLYIDAKQKVVTNFSGTIRIGCQVQRISHNWCGKYAYYVSFVFEGARYYGRYIGFNHTTIKVKKSKA